MPFDFTPIVDFQKSEFSAPLASGHLVTHDIYARGEGPPIVLIQELPGIGKETLRLADRLNAAGFKVFMPHLFGPLERTSMLGNFVRVFCMRKEFHLFKANKSSPIVDWLKAFCRKVKEDENTQGVGVIGMCLTGNFAISLMGDDSVLASVASQPAMPITKQRALHMSPEEVDATRQRIDQTAPMMAMRFEKDPTVTAKKFACIHDAFNESGNERITLKTLPGFGHSVLTLHFVDQEGHPTFKALQEVIEYFSHQLKT
jgi:dienelactone hydrolase